MKLYIIKAWNKSDGCIGQYYVVANGINKAKSILRNSNSVIKKVEVTAEYDILIELPSDEEIENRNKTHNPYPKQKQMHIDWSNGFERGAKWVIDKIKSKQ